MDEKSFIESIFKRRLSRKEFLKFALSITAILPFYSHIAKSAYAQEGFNGRPGKGIKGAYDLVAAKGEDPYNITVKAIETMGGMERFVGKNGVVVVKPNMGWDRTPEQAGNTNPQVVAALVDLSFKAGAKRVNIFDVTCNDPRRCYASSGIAEAAKAKGANVFFPDDWNVVKARLGYDSLMNDWPVLKDAIECDTFINVPVLKHHSLTRLTLCMKNLMGVCGGNRGLMHRDIGDKLVDLTDFIKPDLNIIDGYRMLIRNGPTGGDLKDVKALKTVAVATDPVLADMYACRLAGVDPMEVPYLQQARSRNFGNPNLEGANIRMIEV